MSTMDRGDPRMNLAVAARLKNPDLSLFECLTIGGFIYSSDNGAVLDSENVTLTQRKNQLNRRLRRARKSNASANNDSSATASGTTGKRKVPPSVAPAGGDDQNSSNGSLVCLGSIAKAPAPAITTSGGQSATNFQFPKAAPKKKPRNAASILEEAYGPAKFRQAPLNAAASLNSIRMASSGKSSSGKTDLDSHVGHFLPQVVAPNNMTLSSWASDDAQTQALTTALSKSVTASSLLDDDDDLLDAPLVPNLPDSSPALGSMTNRAQPQQVADPRQELALTYFEREPHALYQRCMLSAGFSIDECQDMSSEAYRKFAFEAWKRECERLQTLLAKYEK